MSRRNSPRNDLWAEAKARQGDQAGVKALRRKALEVLRDDARGTFH